MVAKICIMFILNSIMCYMLGMIHSEIKSEEGSESHEDEF